MKKTHDLLATVGEYTDRETGQKKKRRINVGAVFIDDEGRRSIKLESLPVGSSWSGWIQEYPVKPREDRPEGSRPEGDPY